jgi:hypothetical protein
MYCHGGGRLVASMYSPHAVSGIRVIASCCKLFTNGSDSTPGVPDGLGIPHYIWFRRYIKCTRLAWYTQLIYTSVRFELLGQSIGF